MSENINPEVPLVEKIHYNLQLTFSSVRSKFGKTIEIEVHQCSEQWNSTKQEKNE